MSSSGFSFGFGSTSTSSSFQFGSSASAPAAPASVYLAPQAMAPEQTMQVLQNYLDPNGAYYRFRHMFFNRIAADGTASYKMAVNVPAAFMAQAVERSPDPKHCVPVPAHGSHELLLRLNTQAIEIKEQQTRVDQLQAYIKQMQTAHESSIQQRLQLARTREAALRARLIKALAKIERVRARGYSIQSSEEDFHQRLEQMLAELQRPSHYRGRLAELRAKADGSEHLTAPLPALALTDDEQARVQTVLADQQRALEELTAQLQGDLRDTAIALQAMAPVKQR